MVNIINANAGQSIIISIETLDGYLERADGYSVQVDWILNPSHQAATGFPHAMTKVATGVYYYSMTMPSTSAGLGTYTMSCSWVHPTDGYTRYELFLINVALPFGNSAVYPA